MLTIESVIDNEADKRKIQPLIMVQVTSLAAGIDNSVKLINRCMTVTHNQAVIDAASKLKDDLRDLKELLPR
jgi:hypothetical protein